MAANAPVAATVAPGAAAAAAPASGFLSSPMAGPLLNAGIGLMSGVISKSQQPKQPRGTMFGVDPSKNGADLGPRDVAFQGPVWNPNSFRPMIMQPETF